MTDCPLYIEPIKNINGIEAIIKLCEDLGKNEKKQMQDEFEKMGMKEDSKKNYEYLGVKFWARAGRFPGEPKITFRIEEGNEYGVSLSVEGDTVKKCLDHLPSIRKCLDAVKSNTRIILIDDFLKELGMDKSVKYSYGNSFILQPWMFTKPLVLPEDVRRNYAELDIGRAHQCEEGKDKRCGTTYRIYNFKYECYDDVYYFVMLDEEFDQDKLCYNREYDCFDDFHTYKFALVDPKGFIIPNKAPIIATIGEFYRSRMKFDEYYKIVTSLNIPDSKK